MTNFKAGDVIDARNGVTGTTRRGTVLAVVPCSAGANADIGADFVLSVQWQDGSTERSLMPSGVTVVP